MIYNMKGVVVLDERILQSDNAFAALRVTRIPAPVKGSQHRFKYRLAFVVDGECVLRFERQRGVWGGMCEECTEMCRRLSGPD